MSGSFRSLQWPCSILTNLRMIISQIKTCNMQPNRMTVVGMAPTPHPLHTTQRVYLDQIFRNVTDSQSLALSVLLCLLTIARNPMHRPWTVRHQTSPFMSLLTRQHKCRVDSMTTFVIWKRIRKKMA